VNSLDRFELVGELYERRYHRLRPGKDEAAMTGRSSSEPYNVKQFSEWYGDGCLALDDALECIHRLNEYITQLEEHECPALETKVKHETGGARKPCPSLRSAWDFTCRRPIT
jgi:hypothetical protein